MSERKRTDALDAAKTVELVEANKELEAFAYSVSHDLRAPLRHLDGFAELLRKNWYHQMDAPGQRYLDKITASAQRMGRLVDDLLAFSRLLRADVSVTHVNLRQLQEEVRRELEPDLAGRTVEWIIGDLPDVYGESIHAPPGVLQSPVQRSEVYARQTGSPDRDRLRRHRRWGSHNLRA